MATRNNRTRLEILSDLLLPYEGTLRTGVWKADPDKLLDLYLDAIGEFEDQDLSAGYRLIVTGRMTAFNPNYCPTPVQLAIACREALNVRLSSEARDRGPRASQIAPNVEKSEESRQRVARLLDKFVRRTSVAH